MTDRTNPPSAFKTAITATLSVQNGKKAVDFYKEHLARPSCIGSKAMTGRGRRAAGRLGRGVLGQRRVAREPQLQPRDPRRLLGADAAIVEDPDAVCAQAVAAGATQVSEVSEGYGWRQGRIVDPFGHHWEVGKQVGSA